MSNPEADEASQEVLWAFCFSQTESHDGVSSDDVISAFAAISAKTLNVKAMNTRLDTIAKKRASW